MPSDQRRPSIPGLRDSAVSMRQEPGSGRIEIQIACKDIESLLKTAAEQLLEGFHVHLPHVEVSFASPQKRELVAGLKFQARRGIFAANLEVRAQMVIDEHLVMRFGSVRVTGQGILGRFIASFARRRVHEVFHQQWPLDQFMPPGIVLKDVEFRTTHAAGVIVEIHPSLPSLRPTASAFRPSTAAPRAPVAASGRAAGAGPSLLELFVIDSGHNADTQRIVSAQLTAGSPCQRTLAIFQLNAEQSRQLLERNNLLGHDPILILLDHDARATSGRHGYGCRLNLGRIPATRRPRYVQKLLEIAGAPAESKEKIFERIRREFRHEGIVGTLEILGQILRPE